MPTQSTTSGSRRALFARFRGGPQQIRPPWSINEEAFLDKCTLCHDCLRVCPTGVLVKGHAGYPITVFLAASCTFCSACADACKSGCFTPTAQAPWSLQATIGAHCVERKGVVCRACEESCPSNAIVFRPTSGGTSLPQIDGALCTGCGACVRPCPVQAVSIMSRSAREAS